MLGPPKKVVYGEDHRYPSPESALENSGRERISDFVFWCAVVVDDSGQYSGHYPVKYEL